MHQCDRINLSKRIVMKTSSLIKWVVVWTFLFLLSNDVYTLMGQEITKRIQVHKITPYVVYPLTNAERPLLPSPFVGTDNEEYVIAFTKKKEYAIIGVTLRNNRSMGPQLIIDTLDFPMLVSSGLHDEQQLLSIASITGRSVDEITQLARPVNLSYSGFMADDEAIITVLTGDNRLVEKMGLTHPEMAKPLFHVLNMMEMDLTLDLWNMSRHKWENITGFCYHNREVKVEAEDTKGGQQSIFNDDIEGSFYIHLWTDLTFEEEKYLRKSYHHLSKGKQDTLITTLSHLHIGDMHPKYIMRYGFYEGHTFWRADPLAISFIFGMKSLPTLNELFEGKLDQVLLNHYLE
jgi:hypothetical protein